MHLRLAPILVAGCLVGLAAPAAAADGLESYFRKALTADPAFISARADYDAERENRAIGRSGLLPNVSLSMDAENANYNRQDPGAPGSNYFRYDPRLNSLRLSQPLFDLERWASYKEGDQRAERAEVVLADARQDLALRVSQAWFDYLYAFDTLDLARAQKAAIIGQRIQAENLYKGGIATVTDVEESRARQQLAEVQELTAVSALELRRKELGKVTGEAPPRGAQRIIATPTLEAPQPAKMDIWVEAARTRNLKVVAQQQQLLIAESQIDRARAGYFPSVNLVASRLQTRAPNYFTDRDNTTQYGIQLSMTLFDGFATGARTRQATAQREKIRGDLEGFLSDAEIKSSQAYEEIINGIARVQALEFAVKSAEITLRGMEAGQIAGLRTNSEVLNAQQQLFSARRDLQKERYSYLLNRLQLQAAVGALGDAEITTVDRLSGAPAAPSAQ